MEDKEIDQEKVWDEVAPLWNKYKQRQFGEKGGLVGEYSLLDGFINESDKDVLDLGCGSGRNFFSYSCFDGIIYGVDFSAQQLKFARQNALEKGIKVNLTKANVWDLPFEDNFFDKALFIATLHCVEGEENRLNSVRELYRVLKKGGQAIITVWNKNNKRWRGDEVDKMVSWNLEPDNPKGRKVYRYYHIYTSEELKKLVERVGFKIVKENHSDARNFILFVEK